jgi:hypothetical protein
MSVVGKSCTATAVFLAFCRRMATKRDQRSKKKTATHEASQAALLTAPCFPGLRVCQSLIPDMQKLTTSDEYKIVQNTHFQFFVKKSTVFVPVFF